ncbi:ABC transporter permease [Flammeovirga aprica]|uniref:FtsX-like permease family protein n=1 Tax=Flammeovirga aprica JL-4 TaxID=694437 RepID=A0A7X9RZ43_9BACT|nr:ABC transporter permease [Flammeovirga aprica]NME71361.1 FtsX-like permease family protein [Flammeovirga aprica JL-4]
MLRNYIIIGIRNLAKHGLYSLVNIVGMSMGIAFFALLFLIVKYELSFDNNHVDSKRTYRIVEVIDSQDIGERSASVPIALGPTINDLYPNYVESTVRFFNHQVYSHMIFANGKQYNEPSLYFTDKDFFKIFDFPLVRGKKSNSLSDPQSVIITTTIAKKYFGEEDPLGKKILYDNQYYLTVTGVVDKSKIPTHLDFELLVSFSTLLITNKNIMKGDLWQWNPCWTYVQLKEGVRPEELEADFDILLQDETKFPEHLRDYVQLYLQPIEEIHLYSDLDYEMSHNGDYMYIYIFSAIALLVLIIASINFMNLSAVRYSTRVREVGIRKAIGADQFEIIIQFLVEASILSVLSMFGALVFMELLFPYLYQILGDNTIEIKQIDSRTLSLLIGGSGIFVGALSSFYPMYYLSGFKPIDGLQVTRMLGVKQKKFRTWSVIIQFVIAMFLLFSTYVARKQLNLLKEADVGFNIKNIVVVPLGEVRYSMEQFKEIKKSFLSVDGVESVSGMDEVLGVLVQTFPFEFKKDNINMPSSFYSGLRIRNDFFNVFDFNLVAGDFIENDQQCDHGEVMINEAMVSYLGYKKPDEIIGKSFYNRAGEHVVKGVLQDFHYEPFHKEIEPFLIVKNDTRLWKSFNVKYMVLRLDNIRNWERIEGQLSIKWSQHIPYTLMDSFLLRDKVEASYQKEERLAKVSLIFSIIGVIIANLGLFGLASFITVQKNKEIAIRKALGMENLEAMLFISKEFFLLVGSACFIAWPLSYLAMKLWLENFPQQTTIDINAYIFSGGVTLCLTFLTVSYHVIKAGLKNPVADLKSSN